MDSQEVEQFYEYDDIIATDINSLCRVCGYPCDNLVPIYDRGVGEDLANKIMTYLPIKVTPDDILPVKACLSCEDVILKWHNLFQSCGDADKRFRAMLSEEKLDENVAIDSESKEDEIVERMQSRGSGKIVNHSVEQSWATDSEVVIHDMGVNSIKEELEIGTDEAFSVCTEEESDEDFVTPPQSKRTLLCEHFEVICHHCDTQMLNEIEGIMTHMKNCDKNSKILCKQCKVIISKFETEFNCEICGESFLSRISLRKHTYKHDEITCYECNKSFKNYANLITHKKLHQGSKTNFYCPICDLIMNRKYNLMMHINSHTADHSCKICCASFNSDLLLGHHKLTHYKNEIENYDGMDRQVKCDNCEGLYNSRYKLYMHTVAEHSNDEKKFYCNNCGRIFESEVMLKNHEKAHNEALHECNVCNKKFKKLRGLEEHQNTHFNNRPYKCKECGKEFRYSSNLSQHRTMHTGVRNFACGQCGKKFLRSNTLAMHLKSHQNIRKHVCEFCSASFVQSSSLMKHKKTIHRFCEHCGEMVGDRKQWQIHVWKKCSAKQKLVK